MFDSKYLLILIKRCLCNSHINKSGIVTKVMNIKHCICSCPEPLYAYYVYICDWILEKLPSKTRFHHQMMAVHIN